MWKKVFVPWIIIMFICMSYIPLTIGDTKNNYKKILHNFFSENEDTEYWALLVGVGIYYRNPNMNRYFMLKAIDNLYNSLLDSPNWKADHIHILKGSQATIFNLIRELIWLIRNEDKDDYSLVYITTHGGPLTRNGLPWDIPPKDESDGVDEVLTMYYGFERFDHITDDMLKFFFKFLQSKGLCVIIDSCYSGGFNDTVKNFNPLKFNKQKLGNKISIVKNFEPTKYTQGMVDELAAQGRLILMSCEENEECYGSDFSDLLINGFWGWADYWGNKDGINSAEESFDYAKFWVEKWCDFTPTILDLYPGEYPVTYSKVFE